MDYEKTPHHCAPDYRSFIDHLQKSDFTWRPYLDLEDVDPTDGQVGSSKTLLICFTTVEMHHTDRVKLQFGILQGIRDAPMHGGVSQINVNHQWSHNPWKNHLKEERRQWHNCADYVLQGDVMSQECKPSREYMEWYKSVTNFYLSPNSLLFDPRIQPSTSNFQHPIPSSNTHTQHPFTSNQQSFLNNQQTFCTPNNLSYQHNHPLSLADNIINKTHYVLQGDVMSQECKPSREYMEWYKSVTNLYLSPNNLLLDPRIPLSTSNFQHSIPSSSTHTQHPFTSNQQPFLNTQQTFRTPNNLSYQHNHPLPLADNIINKTLHITHPNGAPNNNFSDFTQPTTNNSPQTILTPHDPTYQTPQQHMPYSQSQYFTSQDCYQPIVHSPMHPSNQPN